jgi:hypothetical protein
VHSVGRIEGFNVEAGGTYSHRFAVNNWVFPKNYPMADLH